MAQGEIEKIRPASNGSAGFLHRLAELPDVLTKNIPGAPPGRAALLG